MEETIVDSQKSREYLEALKGAWNEILDSISAQDRALLLGSEPVLANSENAILAFDAAFNAEQAMKRTDLNDMFGNIMSKAAGFHQIFWLFHVKTSTVSEQNLLKI